MANLNFNKITLGGRLTTDPELKKTQQGTSVTSFSLAVNRKANKDVTDFINLVAWRNTAEFICKYFKKGSSIMVEGELQVRTYEDKQGNKRQAYEVIVSDAYFVDSKNDNEGFVPPTSQIEPNFEDFNNEDEDLPF